MITFEKYRWPWKCCVEYRDVLIDSSIYYIAVPYFRITWYIRSCDYYIQSNKTVTSTTPWLTLDRPRYSVVTTCLSWSTSPSSFSIPSHSSFTVSLYLLTLNIVWRLFSICAHIGLELYNKHFSPSKKKKTTFS